jgi:hypothetical protein
MTDCRRPGRRATVPVRWEFRHSPLGSADPADIVMVPLPVLQQHFSLIFGRGVGDDRVAGVVGQFTAALVMGQFRTGLVAAPPA